MAYEKSAFHTGRYAIAQPVQRSAAGDAGNVCGYCGGSSGAPEGHDRSRYVHACRCGAHKNVVSARERIQQQMAG